MLQEHHAVGRLDAFEFNERMSKVLSARTQAVIDELFVDLPDPKPALPPPSSWPEPVLVKSDGAPLVPVRDSSKDADPWYAQWWMILVAVALAAVTRGNTAVIVPLMAVWLWGIYPNLQSTKDRRRRSGHHPGSIGARLKVADYAAELTKNQRKAITRELRRGRKINAVAMYQDFSGTNRAYASDVIETWSRELER